MSGYDPRQPLIPQLQAACEICPICGERITTENHHMAYMPQSVVDNDPAWGREPWVNMRAVTCGAGADEVTRFEWPVTGETNESD